MPVERQANEPTMASAYIRAAEELIDQSNDPGMTKEETAVKISQAQVYATLAVAMTNG